MVGGKRTLIFKFHKTVLPSYSIAVAAFEASSFKPVSLKQQKVFDAQLNPNCPGVTHNYALIVIRSDKTQYIPKTN